ncbi:MAG TPA: hypothetical protein VFB20_03860 [Burkholderiales bacterium]|nr:hypothetical protein [Burkholderiales bacterium]
MAIEFCLNPGGEYLEVVARTELVNKEFLDGLVDLTEKKLAVLQNPTQRILLIVEAPASKLSVFESYEVWERALEKGLPGIRVGYVVTGRPLSAQAKFIQGIARKQAMALRFFESRERAIEWLTGARKS